MKMEAARSSETSLSILHGVTSNKSNSPSNRHENCNLSIDKQYLAFLEIEHAVINILN
jgi:hypothetical protein